MKIVHIVKHLEFGNGTDHATVDLACAQSARGDEVMVVAAGGGALAPVLAASGVAHHDLVFDPKKPLSSLRCVFKFNALLARFRPDVLHAQTVGGAVLAWPFARAYGIPLITTVHGSFSKFAALMALGDRVIAVSQADTEVMQRRGIAAGKIRVVPNGTLNSAIRRYFQGSEDRVEALKSRLKGLVVTTICGLHPRKGVPDLLAAFAQLHARFPESTLLVAGDGPHRQEYEAMAGKGVIFLGTMRDTRALLDLTDVFVLASHAEPFGLVLIEARESHCAVLGSEVGGIPQALDGGRAGQLFRPGDPGDLAGHLRKIAADPQWLVELKQRSQVNLTFWSLNRVCDQVSDIYAEASAPTRIAAPAR